MLLYLVVASIVAVFINITTLMHAYKTKGNTHIPTFFLGVCTTCLFINATLFANHLLG